VSEPQKWIEALEARGSKWKPITIVPFADELPDVEVDGPALVYGSTTLIKNAHQKNWNPGTFFNPDNFRPSIWNEKYGRNMFNFDGEVYRIRDLHTFKGDDCFIRPNSDMKEFSGSRIDREGLVKFYDEVMAGLFPFDADTEVFIAPLKPIYKEYRIFIVNGGPVAWSQYRLRSMLAKDAYVPRKFIVYAREMAEIWSPEKAYVMDICTDDNEKPHILELNCFNASGVYSCDVESIIEAVEGMFK
jgi:hypothetical protein